MTNSFPTGDGVSLVLSRSRLRPQVGVILGSGLGGVADELEEPVTVPWTEIPGLPRATVPGHSGELVLGVMEGVRVAAMKGRYHIYEGYTPAQVGLPVQLLSGLGAQLLVVTNAAGGLRPTLEAGHIMIIDDHINLPGLCGLSPLVGVDGGNRRFVRMSDAYDAELRRAALDAAGKLGIPATSGVYAMVVGPSYETAAEARFLRQLGADAVGMSTVPEVVVARWLGMRVLAISCITNTVPDPPSHAAEGHRGVLAAASAMAPDLARLLRAIMRHVRATGHG